MKVYARPERSVERLLLEVRDLEEGREQDSVPGGGGGPEECAGRLWSPSAPSSFPCCPKYRAQPGSLLPPSGGDGG